VIAFSHSPPFCIHVKKPSYLIKATRLSFKRYKTRNFPSLSHGRYGFFLSEKTNAPDRIKLSLQRHYTIFLKVPLFMAILHKEVKLGMKNILCENYYYGIINKESRRKYHIVAVRDKKRKCEFLAKIETIFSQFKSCYVRRTS
jgi:hypothetical protein